MPNFLLGVGGVYFKKEVIYFCICHYYHGLIAPLGILLSRTHHTWFIVQCDRALMSAVWLIL